ncbi:MAG: hypothetical protein BMS9Abin30_0874 [Gammaproteobacteria bacterium]|nr:MAG: hypothetical protein BMS9Abin30_0874 [Gammaproteobacteria bacterium]
MQMKKFFKWLLLTTTALAIVIGILLYNPGLFKGPLENYLSKLQIKQLDFEGPRGKIRSSLSIIPRDTKMADVKVDLSAEKLVLNLSGQPPENLSQSPAFDIQIHADGQGRDLRELAGSLNGSLLLGSAGGTMEGVNLRILDTFILDEIFSIFMPKAKIVDDQDLSCVAAIVKIANGKMETSPAFAFTTGRIALIAKQKIQQYRTSG